MNMQTAISSTLYNLEPEQGGCDIWQEPNYGLKLGNNKKKIPRSKKNILAKISSRSRRINRKKSRRN